MERIDYDERCFVPLVNAANGEVGEGTVFHYRQQGDIVWATYTGGRVSFGTLVAKVTDANCLEMRYSHVNDRGELMTGECFSTPEVLPDGRLRLHERWRWTCGDESAGESVVEEVRIRESS